ncbi:MAG: hypothetical protein O3C19_01085 [Bacteroidetes bacterium]|nr:hypothetical protein [Bacteroidota bacterium]
MSRENIHSKIDELLELLSIHNGRLSLHAEKLSQLDIDVLRKQCIDLYDQVNLLALQGKIVAKPSVQKITPQESSSTPAPVEQMITEVVVSKNEITAQPVEEIIEPEVVVIPEPKLPVKKEKTEDDMLSLFEKFSNQPIESIPKAISLAKRFELQGEFFNDDAEAYNSFMVELDQASSRDRAFEIYHAAKEKYKWENEELRDELKVLMYRKHL